MEKGMRGKKRKSTIPASENNVLRMTCSKRRLAPGIHDRGRKKSRKRGFASQSNQEA